MDGNKTIITIILVVALIVGSIFSTLAVTGAFSNNYIENNDSGNGIYVDNGNNTDGSNQTTDNSNQTTDDNNTSNNNSDNCNLITDNCEADNCNLPTDNCQNCYDLANNPNTGGNSTNTLNLTIGASCFSLVDSMNMFQINKGYYELGSLFYIFREILALSRYLDLHYYNGIYVGEQIICSSYLGFNFMAFSEMQDAWVTCYDTWNSYRYITHASAVVMFNTEATHSEIAVMALGDVVVVVVLTISDFQIILTNVDYVELMRNSGNIDGDFTQENLSSFMLEENLIGIGVFASSGTMTTDVNVLFVDFGNASTQASE